MRRFLSIVLISLTALTVPALNKRVLAQDSSPFTQNQPFISSPSENPPVNGEKLNSHDSLSNLLSDPTLKNLKLNKNPSSSQSFFSEPFYAGNEPIQPTVKKIGRGSQGSEVSGIQRRLELHGFTPGAIDGAYGAQTLRSVEEFQRAKNLPVTGSVDEVTWNALATSPTPTFSQSPGVSSPPEVVESPTDSVTLPLRKGSQGESVKQLQEYLVQRGYTPGMIDGIFGNRTRKAVKDFQFAKGLTPDGVVDSLTWTQLTQN